MTYKKCPVTICVEYDKNDNDCCDNRRKNTPPNKGINSCQSIQVYSWALRKGLKRGRLENNDEEIMRRYWKV